MYQAAVAKREDTTFSSGVMEESEVCSLPGGLASVRKQFETQETATSQSITQLHFQHRTVQETSNSEVRVMSSSKQVFPGSQQLNFSQQEMATESSNNMTPSFDNHNNEAEEDFPRYSAKELRAHFERTIEEAAPSKQMRIVRDINRSKWSSDVTRNTAATEVYETPATEAAEDTTTPTDVVVLDYDDFPPPPPEDSDYLPPPPPDLLEMPSDTSNLSECCYSPEPRPPEPAHPSKCPVNKEAYFKQRNMNELKRLYRHIHPEVRKNIEREHLTNGVELQGQEDIYEEDGDSGHDLSMSPDEEYSEWDELLQGEVQSMRWMFENKPLDAIKDETPDEDSDNRKIPQQEIIVGKDVRRTAWMFETKTMDELGSHNTDSTEYRNKFNKLDKGDVRAAAWLFETQPMDSLNRMHTEEDLTKEIVFTEEDGNATIYMIDDKCVGSLGHTETIDESHLLSLRSVLEEINCEVKTVTSTFDTQFKCVLMGQSSQMLEIKSVRKIETELESSIASRWLFDTQPLDMENRGPAPLKLVCSLSMEDNHKGDWGRWLFEIKNLSSLEEWENSMVQKEETIRADVRKHRLTFETQPVDSLRDESTVRAETIEDIIGGNVRSARHFFESSPQVSRKNCPEVGKLKRPMMNEEEKGDVRHQKWRFESQPLEHIREDKKQVVRTVNVEEDLTQEDGTSCRADVRKNCWVFETQPMDTLKDDANARPSTKEEIISGNVSSARHYFEAMPADESKELAEVGKLRKAAASVEERGDVRHQRWRFESQPLEHIREEQKEVVRTVDLGEIDKVDVSNYKQIFESADVSRKEECQKVLIEGVTSGSVRSNKSLFESTPLYAMQDSSGHFHEVKTVRREEVVSGDVTTCKWMFETRPVDQFDKSISEYQIIKGISKQEVESGDVKTAKWLFETQPLDAIKYFSNIEDEEAVDTRSNTDIVKGDVKTCKWLFETKPMDILYEKTELRGRGESEEIQRGDVQTCTWLFETQALDTIHDESETVLKTCSVNQDEVRGKDVRTACFLFETEKLEDITGGQGGAPYKRVTEIDIDSGDVSRMKCKFENQTSDIVTSTSEETMQRLKSLQCEDIQRGNVVGCRWLFENRPVDAAHSGDEESTGSRAVSDIQPGNVDKGRFIFETYTLDRIQEEEEDPAKVQKIVREDDEKGDVRNYTMMFETQPLYAIQDREGQYHEVTTVTSEEVMRGDVVKSRWLFETKPLDSIRDTDEVYVIKAVTQEDVQRGDVTSAKWKFETQPLDRIAVDSKASVRTVDDIQGGNVRVNRHRFESDAASQESVRTVNVSEIQRGDVRTAKWRFETQSIDKIKSVSSENLVETVQKEEVAKGDVKQSVWLFERNPLDHIKEVEEDDDAPVGREEIPTADVKTTTWLFETTPFDDFNETSVERSEIVGKSIKGTLEELYSQRMVSSKGILLEADEIGDVRMAKYRLMNKQAPEIQREDVIRGDLQSIMMNLLNKREAKDRQVVLNSEEKGDISSTVHQLFHQQRDSSVEKEEILRGDIQEAMNSLLRQDGSATRGILIQEDERGDVQMTVYSLLNNPESVTLEKEDVVRGDVKSALQRLSSPDDSSHIVKIKVDDAEKGNVQFYSTCIESGALDHLKRIHLGPDESPAETMEKEEIIRGDIKGTKLILGRNRTHIERTVEDVVPGDVQNTVKVFMTEPAVSLEHLQKEEIVKGDLKAVLTSLSESVNQTTVVEREEVVKGDIPKAMRCLEKAHKQHKEVEKPDIVRGNIRGALRSLEESATSRVEAVVEDLVPGDVKATLKSLEQAKQAVREVEKEDVVRGDIHTAMQCLHDASNEKRTCQQDIDVQGDVRGTIQLLLEPASSPKMQRKASLEGDVKMSIRSLYDMPEDTQIEKEEVIKGDVKGTIKSLLETAQRQTMKIKVGSHRRVRVKQAPPVKSLNGDAHRNVQKIKTANSAVKSEETQTHAAETKIQKTQSHSTQQATKRSTTVVEHKTITQNHGIKTLKTEFRNLNSNSRGVIKEDKTKVRRDDYIPKPKGLESELPLPPPPPPMADLDLPPPPTPPPPPYAESELDHLLPPPPPPPLTSEQDFLPPPPSQQELDNMPSQTNHPSPGKATKMMVKKVKAPTLCPVPKLGPEVEISKTRQATSETSRSLIEMSQTKSQVKTQSSKAISYDIPPPPESPRPLKKVYVSPIKFTPPPSPPPFMRGKMSKFNTPLIKAEEKYRLKREENTPPTTPTPTYVHDSVSAALEMLSDQQGTRTATDSPEEGVEKSLTNIQSYSPSAALSTHTERLPQSALMSSAKHQVISVQAVKDISVQHTSSISTIRQQTITTSGQQIVTVSSQSGQTTGAERVQTVTSDVEPGDLMTGTQRESTNPKIGGTGKSQEKKRSGKAASSGKSLEAGPPEEDIRLDKSEDVKKPDETPSEVSDDLASQQPRREHTGTEDHEKPSKSPQPEHKKKTEDGVTPRQEKVSDKPAKPEKATSSPNAKTGKAAQKGKKNKQEKSIDVIETKKSESASPEGVKKVELRDAVEEVRAELKEQVHKVTPSSVAATSTTTAITAVTVTANDNQAASSHPTKKKKKSKRSKGGTLASQAKDTSTESKTTVLEKSVQSQKSTTVVQISKEVKERCTQVHKAGSNEHQHVEQQEAVSTQKQAKTSQKKRGGDDLQNVEKEKKQESRDVPSTAIAEAEGHDPAESTAESIEASQRREVQGVISQITELLRKSRRIDSKSVRTLLSTVPEWLIGLEERSELDGSAVETNMQKLEDIISHVRRMAEAKLMLLDRKDTVERHQCEAASERVAVTPRISKISIGSAKVESQTRKTVSQEIRKQEMSQAKTTDLRAPSPSLRMFTPSPTFITIESTRRTDSPQRVTPSPTLLCRPPTPPTPPPRRSDTPTSRINRITPSPTFDRAENLARLKDATAKLSRGVTPPPVLSLQHVTEKKSEIVGTPPSFHRQFKIDTQAAEASETSDTAVRDSPPGTRKSSEELEKAEKLPVKDTPGKLCTDANEPKPLSGPPTDTSLSGHQSEREACEASDISETMALSASVKDKREFFEGAQKAEMNKTYVRKAPIEIPERLGPDMEDPGVQTKEREEEFPKVDLSGLVNRFESPEEKFLDRREHFSLADLVPENTEVDKEIENILEQEMANFNIGALRKVFEQGERKSSFKKEKSSQERSSSSLSEPSISKQEWRSCPTTPLPPQRAVVETAPEEPSTLSETKSFTEHFSNVDEFGNVTLGTKTTTSFSEHSQTVSTQPPPFSYADVVKRNAAVATHKKTYDDDSTEELLRNFHKTWSETETVFKSLGYSVSEDKTSQFVAHQTTMAAAIADSSSKVGALHGLSEEGLSNGRSDSGQKEVP